MAFVLKKMNVKYDDDKLFRNLIESEVIEINQNILNLDLNLLFQYIVDDQGNSFEEKYKEQTKQLKSLQDKYNDLEKKEKELSDKSFDIKSLQEENSLLKKENKDLNLKLAQDNSIEKQKDSRISLLEKELKTIQNIKGISDKFGTFRSLKITLQVFHYIREMVSRNQSVRWAEIRKHFKNYGWKDSTINYHLAKLRNADIIIERRNIRGEYVINDNKVKEESNNFEELAMWILGSEVYDFIKESWSNQ